MKALFKNSSNLSRPKGESYVWLCSAGLTVGVLMILGLMGLIGFKGISAFWPKDIHEVQLAEGYKFLGHQQLTGILIEKRRKQLPRAAKGKPPYEHHFFVGNKEHYGQAFYYIDAEAIVALRKPAAIMIAEQLEGGHAIFYPKRLLQAGKSPIEASQPQFQKKLQQLIRASNKHWRSIAKIETHTIGRIHSQIESNRFEQGVLREKLGDAASGDPKLQELSKLQASLQAQYEQYAEKATQLRERQYEDMLEVLFPDGQVAQIPIGKLLRLYQPNTLSLGAKFLVFFQNIWHFLIENPREANTQGGIFPAIFGTLVMTLVMSIFVTPFGVLAAIYLHEYAKASPFTRFIRIGISNLAGVPSIVYGVFGLGFFVYFLGGSIDKLFFSEQLPTPMFGTGGILWASLTLALMTLPIVVVATEEALSAISRSMREASLALGASKWQTVRNIVLPSALPGILTGLILAMARGAGEVAPLMLVGVVKFAPDLPLDLNPPFIHLDRKFMHLGFHIYDLGFQSPDSEAAKPMVFATTFFLIVLVFILNFAAVLIRERLRKRYATSAF